MANKKITYTVDLEAQAQQFQQTIEKAKSALKSLSATPEMTDKQFFTLNKALDSMLAKMREVKTQAGQGFISTSDFNATQKKITDLKNRFNNWVSDFKSLGLSPEDFLPDTDEYKKDTKRIEEINAELSKLRTQLKSLKKNDLIDDSLKTKAGVGNIKGIQDIISRRRTEIESSLAEKSSKLGKEYSSFSEEDYSRYEQIFKESKIELDKLVGAGRSKELSARRQELKAITETLKNLLPQLRTYLDLQKELGNLSEVESSYTEIAEKIKNAQATLQEIQPNVDKAVQQAQDSIKKDFKIIDEAQGEAEQATGALSNAVEKGRQEYEDLDNQAKNMNGLKSYFTSLVSATAIYMRLRQAVIGAFNDFKEIDSELNAISIVTGKTMKELWGNFGNLNSIAQQYGVTTKNVIEVQKLYYQQGRNAVEVTQLTGETLKFAKISGLDFANATDYMTAALNAYNIAAKDASEITDTYAALSAAAAVDSQEVAVAMSKVASMAAAAGSSFKDTSAYLSKIIEVTREAPEILCLFPKSVA